MLKLSNIGDFVRCSEFSSSEGNDEIFLSITTPQGISFSEALNELEKGYDSALAQARLSDSTMVFSRIFLSDVYNQKQALVAAELFKRLSGSGTLSIIEQKSLQGGPVSLLSYHVRDPRNQISKQMLKSAADDDWHNSMLVNGCNYSMLWTANHTGGDTFDAYAQTNVIFESLNTLIEQHRMNLLDNAIRTWVYVRDVDNHYKGMVRARREHFTAHGLTDATRYLASTGILGAASSPEMIVSVDSLSIRGLKPEQIVRMEALTHLSPTILYGVTFERGLRIRFGDRSHLHISGTASIDNRGDVLHLGNAEQQTRRTIENIRALLAVQKATLDDLVYLIVYVRNAHDRHFVEKVLGEEISPHVPLVLVEAAVCRPAWLVEMEGIAITPDNNGYPPFL
jgi:enamine deaminase RidA (YjgF/YER057c/UK114 family)